MPEYKPAHWMPERPISGTDEDRLGLAAFADHIAAAILSQPLGEGLTIGIPGGWGSGKSSLLNLLCSRLEAGRRRGDPILGAGNPLVLRFSPWVVGTRAALLPEFFSVLTRGFEAVKNPSEGLDDETHKLLCKLRAELQKYESLLGSAAAAAPVVEHAVGVHGFGMALKLILAAVKKPAASLAVQKDRVIKLLRSSPRRVVVIVDDLDRLEPAEAVEVLRLVKAVADFPNVFYVMPYAPDLLENAVEQHLRVPDGHAFLEKLVQVEYPIPLPDDFDLRGWFRKEIDTLIEHAVGTDRSDHYEDRLSRVIAVDAGKVLKTPRDVVRALNSFRAGWLPMRKQVDVADYVWLTLVKLKRPDLYEWLREYTREVSQVELGAHSDSEPQNSFVERLEMLCGSGRVLEKEVGFLQNIFPGIIYTQNTEGIEVDLFSSRGVDQGVLRAHKRLASGHYSRFYFAPTPAAGTFTSEDEERLDAILGDRAELAEFIIEMTARSRPQGSNMGAYTVDALVQRHKSLTQDQHRAILLALCDTMDKVVLGRNPDQLHEWRVWEVATLFLDNTLAAREDSGEREGLIEEVFGRGASLEWLTRSVSRLMSGKIGHRASLTDNGLILAREILKDRLHSDVALDSIPYLLDFLWSWKRLGDDQGPRRYVERHITSDVEFLIVMRGLRSWMFMANKAFRPINVPDTKAFIDREAARARLQCIAEVGGPSADVAIVLLEDMRVGDEYYREGQETFFAEPEPSKTHSPTEAL